MLFEDNRKPNKGYTPYKDALDDCDNLDYGRIFEKIDGLEFEEGVDRFVESPQEYGEDDQ